MRVKLKKTMEGMQFTMEAVLTSWELARILPSVLYSYTGRVLRANHINGIRYQLVASQLNIKSLYLMNRVLSTIS